MEKKKLREKNCQCSRHQNIISPLTLFKSFKERSSALWKFKRERNLDNLFRNLPFKKIYMLYIYIWRAELITQMQQCS